MVSDSKHNVPLRIPGYQLRGEIGRGGIASVYLAVQESLDRQVALKVMSPILVAEPNFSERFIREGRTIAQLNHPGIVTIYDIAAENYHHYIAMEYLPGGTLKEKMRQTMTQTDALTIVRQVALALAYAHEQGIVHRDVKPENILFRGNGAPVLTDFGIAKTVGADSSLTHTGIIVGTPRYISPEQADGRGTDGRSDIYALGVILFEILAGKPPFDNGDNIALLYSHVNDPIPALPEQHGNLQPLVEAAMAKDPDRRVSDGRLLADMIRVIQRKTRHTTRHSLTPVSAAPERSLSGTGQRPPLPKQRQGRRPRLLRPWVGILVVAVFAAVLMWQRLPVPAPERTVATAPRPAATAAAPESAPATATTPAARMTAAPEPAPATAARTTAAPEPAADTSDTEHVGRTQAGPSAAAADHAGDTKTPPAPLSTPSRRNGTAMQTSSAAARRRSSARSGPSSDVESVLQLAESQMTLGQIDEPEGENALASYRNALSLVRQHPQALAGLERVGNHFLSRGRELAELREYDRAAEIIERGLRAVPEYEPLITLRSNVSLMRTAEREFAEAEKHYWGQDGTTPDTVVATKWYRKAAEKGHLMAQYFFGIAVANGDGVQKDEAAGRRWLQRAATRGSEDAQFNLGLGLIFGPEPDPEAASQWVVSLANRNYAPAYKLLGWMYNTGTGVDKSMREAIRWNVKHVMSKPPAAGSPAARTVGVWQDRFNAAFQKINREQRPPEPN